MRIQTLKFIHMIAGLKNFIINFRPNAGVIIHYFKNGYIWVLLMAVNYKPSINVIQRNFGGQCFSICK